MYQAVARYQRARQRLADLALPQPAPIQDALTAQMAPLRAMLQENGLDVPPELMI